MDNLFVMVLVIGLPLVIMIYLFSSYNHLQRGKIKVEEAESGIGVALTKRFDILTKMVETVKECTGYEKGTLESIVQSRNTKHLSQTTILDKQAITQQIDQALREIHVVMEQYPDLKSSENFKHLQATINDVEEHLQAARRVYNANVSSYNQRVKLFPSNVVANLFRFEAKEFFETEQFKRQDVEIKF